MMSSRCRDRLRGVRTQGLWVLVAARIRSLELGRCLAFGVGDLLLAIIPDRVTKAARCRGVSMPASQIKETDMSDDIKNQKSGTCIKSSADTRNRRLEHVTRMAWERRELRVEHNHVLGLNDIKRRYLPACKPRLSWGYRDREVDIDPTFERLIDPNLRRVCWSMAKDDLVLQ